MEYLVLQFHQSDLVVRVPAKNAELVGVRDVVDEAGLKMVFGYLRETDVEEVGNWSCRYKANQERLASGDVNKVAELVRDLWRRDQGKGLSPGEKSMLAKARQVLVGELALATVKDEAKADDLLKQIEATIERHKAEGITAEEEQKPVVLDDDIDLDNLSFDDVD